MALECELKYLEADLSDLADRLEKAGAQTSGRYFEANTVFDRSDRSLKKDGILLRLREKRGKTVLTVKRPHNTPAPSALKVFEEIETGVEDGAAMAEALSTLGFAPAFRYEKVREKWRHLDCTICLDHLPFGEFVEIEGDEPQVLACAAKLGLNASCTTKATYHGLNIEYRVEKGLEPDENFVFESAEKASLIDELEKL